MSSVRLLTAPILLSICALAQQNAPQQPSAQMPPERAAEKSAPAPQPENKPAQAQPQAPAQTVAPSQPEPELAKPESDRADEGITRQQPEALGFRNPNREQLQQKIQNALRNDPNLQGALFTVNISEDAIDISGNANTAKQRLAARRIVQSFAGNLKVRERINVAGASPTPGSPQPNGSIAKPPGPGPNPDDQPPPDANRPHNDPKKDGDKSENPR